MKATEKAKKDQEAIGDLRNRMGEAAKEANKILDAIFKELQSASEDLADRRKELSISSERIQSVHGVLNSKRSQLKEVETKIHEESFSKTLSSFPKQCP